MNCRLGIFAKYWQPGLVKTRLAQDIGPECASRIQQLFLRTLLRRFESFRCSKQLCYTLASRSLEFAEVAGPGWALAEQGDGQLGERLFRFFVSAFRDGAEKAVVLGSDSPNLPHDRIAQAFDALSDSAVVVGPSDDGGYYLVGIRGPMVPDMFDGISWSTSAVWSQTVERLATLQLPFAQLAAWYDVDRYADLTRLVRDLAEVSDPELVELRTELQTIANSNPNLPHK